MQYRGSKKNILAGLFSLTIFSSIISFEVKQVNDEHAKAKIFHLNEPLDFTIGTHAIYMDKNNPQIFGFYFGSNQEKKGNEYSISAAFRGVDTILSTAPSKINLNMKPDQDNPLNGAKISLLSLISKYPVAVKSGQDNIVYVYNEGGGLLSTPKLNDSNGQESSKIIQFATADNGALLGSAIFAAVKNNKDQIFGTTGSGIAFIKVEDKIVETKKNEKESAKKDVIRELIVTNANSKDKVIKENIAASFTGSLKALKINNNAEIISDIIDMHWDEALSRLYIALQIKSNLKPNSGAKALVACRVISGKIYFDSIVSDLALFGNDQIIGTTQSNNIVSILKVRTMHTSTLLDYLILVGGNGTSENVGNQLYALPIVNKTKEKINLSIDRTHGTLAQFNQEPKEYFNSKFFVSRAFTKPATTNTDLLTLNDIAAKIGNGPVPLERGKKITDMFVIGDSVYVTIADDSNEITQSGVFYSQPIFDNLGRIVAWTNWQRFAIDKKVFAGAFDIWTGQFWYLTGSNLNNVNRLNRTEWQSDDKNKLQNTINLAFKENGGIQRLFDFSKKTVGFNDLSILIATSFQKIALIETGKKQENIFKPVEVNDLNISYSDNGRFPSKKANLIFIQGGILDDIKNIIACDIASDGINSNWLVVGGTNGIAVLANADGNGWDGNINSLSEVPAGLSFKKIGNYTFVKKIKFDGKFLYILTDKTFDRIELTSQSIKNNKLNVVTLANFENEIFNSQVSFNDFDIKDKLGLLGTSIGLFRIGNSKDVATVKNKLDSNWTQVIVPGSIGPILQVKLNSVNNNIAQLYVLSGYIGFYQTKINRLFVNLNNHINNRTIIPVNDKFIKNELASLYDFESFKNGVLPLGSTMLSFNSKDSDVELALKSTPFLHTASRAINTNSFKYNLGINKFDEIYGILNDSTTGNMIVNGNFGFIINQ